MRLTPAEALLQELGVTRPDEIDLEAIAFHVNACVRYTALDGCDARIIGSVNQAIISVNQDSQWRRQRFSIAHELGHWHHHRGRCLTCRVEDYLPHSSTSVERAADNYAADLLMPRYLFRPMADNLSTVSFGAISFLANEFDTSRTATAIRFMENTQSPAMLVCHGPHGYKWFCRSPRVPDRWFPQQELAPESLAFDIQYGGKPNSIQPRTIKANAWLKGSRAHRFQIEEQTIANGPDETLTLLILTDDAMLNED